MIRSMIPGFIKRKSMSSSTKDEPYSDLFKETDESHHVSAESADEIRLLREKYGLGLDSDRRISQTDHHIFNSSANSNSKDHQKICVDNEVKEIQRIRHRYSVYEGIFGCGPELSSLILPNFSVINTSEIADTPMVDQEDIIALTRHVRSFSDALNNLRNTFKESCVDGVYNDVECQSMAQSRLGDVLTILKGVLSKYPPLHSPDILVAAANIINKIKKYDYAEGEEGPTDFYAAIDQLALSFSSSVSDFLVGDSNSANAVLDQDDDHNADHDMDGEEEYDSKFFSQDDYDEAEKFNESEDSLDRLQGSYDLQRARDTASVESDENVTPPLKESNPKRDTASERTDELDRTLKSIEGSVDIALQRTKVWAKYAKDILNYIERRSHLELEFSRQTAKLAHQTRNSIVEESYLPFQSIYVTALDNDIQFANNYHRNCQTQLQQIVDKLTQRQKDHDAKRSRIKTSWKAECKKLTESRENLRGAKKLYIQKQKDLEKFNKQQSEGKDEKGGFSIGKKKGQEDFIKSAEESEEQYRTCVVAANTYQQEIEKTKTELLLELRQLVYQCDLTMKSITVAYFQMMNILLSPLPIQYRALVESSNLYEEGQQFADFVRLQQSTCNQAMSPTYQFDKYKGEGADRRMQQRHATDNNLLSISSEDYSAGLTRRLSINSAESDKPPSPGGRKVKQAWGSLPRNKGSATDDTDSVSSRSLPGTPQGSPSSPRKALKTGYSANENYLDDDHGELKEAIMKSSKQMPGLFKNQKLSAAAKMHKFRKLRSPSKCKECDSYVYFNGAECERCGIICHKKCLEKLAIKCGNKRLPRKMTTFGVDFHQHLAATRRKDIPYIIEKCIDTIDECGLGYKGIYRVSGVKSKVEKLCQQFETGGDLVDLSTTPPHFVASVLKLYLRQLPEPLLTFKQYQNFIQVAKDSMNLKLGANEIEHMNSADAAQYEENIRQLHEIVKQLPPSNFYTAAKLIRHLKRVAENCEENQMSCANLAIVFGPTLLRPEGDPSSLAAVMDMSHQTKAVELLILNSHIFSVDDTGELDIETLIGEKYRAPSSTKVKKKKMREPAEKSPRSNADHAREDSNLSVGTEFSQELMFMMESSQKRMDEDRQKTEEMSPGQLPGQALTEDYDNTDPDRESDILSDLPDLPKTLSYNKSMSIGSETTDYDSGHSRLSSQGSWPANGVQFESTSPVKLPDASSPNDEDDDVWMSKFGQDILPKHRTESVTEIKPEGAGGFQSTKKNTSTSRLETTTYSFSLGSTQKQPEEEGEEGGSKELPISPGSDDTSTCSDAEPSPWVKRDGIERVPVRKHLKTVNIKATTSITSVQTNQVSSPELSPTGLRSTPFSLTDSSSANKQSTAMERDRFSSTTSTDSEKDNQQLMLKVGTASKQLRDVQESKDREFDVAVPTSPTRSPPAVLPKPKKPLDKKSWTADLIKSKSQSLPEPPHPGSLNDKLLSRRQDDTKPEEVRMSRTSSLNNKSVKEILTKFQDTPSLSSDSSESTTAVKNDFLNQENNIAEEKYV